MTQNWIQTLTVLDSLKLRRIIMENTPRCQSCYMAMAEEKQFGKEANGEKNADYCEFCYQGGKFTSEASFEEAVEANIQFWKVEGDKSDAEARERIMSVFPTLKRWKAV